MSESTRFPRGQLLLATRNRGKLRELATLLAELPLELIGLADLADRPGVPEVPEVEETGDTFVANALLKARAAVAATGLAAAADDSGLFVDALDGAPGVRSARFSGPQATPETNNRLLLDRLQGIPEERRGARFICAAALCLPDGEEFVVEGIVEGRILDAPRGTGGFGYDPLFFFEPFGVTFAESPPAEKNRVSHRAHAFRRLAARISAILAGEQGAERDPE